MSSDEQDLKRFVRAARALEGWQLEFEPERLGPDPPWSYEARAHELCERSASFADLGTGGGEVLSRLLPAGGRVVATEQWHVNAPVAARRLAGLVPVVRADSLRLPFADAAFDLVLARHEAIEPAEIARVLAPAGRFLTEQVTSEYWPELRDVFPEMTRFPDHFTEYARGLRAAGLALETQQQHGQQVRFRALGPLVYHLVACPWVVPGFSIVSHADALEQLRDRVESDDGLVLSTGHYLLQALA